MAEITMPRLSDTMEEGTIASWLKKPGEQVNKGDVIAQIETDKATMDLTAFEAGTLQEILAPEGTTVAIGKPVARIGSGPGKSTSAPADQGSAPPAEGATPATEAAAPPAEGAAPATEAAAPPAAEETGSVEPKTKEARENVAEAAEPTESPSRQEQRPTTTQPSEPPSRGDQRPAATEQQQAPAPGAEGADGKVRASPMARHIAAEHGLDISRISGSGPQGRVIRADVEAALSAPSAEAAQPAAAPAPAPAAEGADDERVSLSQMRRTIARRMAESTRTVPHFFLTTTVDATEMASLRKQINAQTADDGIKITFNDMVVKGVAVAIRKVPEVNVSFAEDSVIRHKRVHIGVAVATDRGLIVPVIRDVDQKGIGQVARETRDLAEKANSGKLQPPDYTGGTFTVSNLGMFGVEQFNAVINPPEAAILAVGAITREPTEREGQIVVRDRMKLTLSVDHRALDGAIGARYLQALKAVLEKPMLLLV